MMDRKGTVGLAVLAIFICAWAGGAAFRRSDLNYSLSDAVGRGDITAVKRLLEAGAEATAPWSGYRLRDQIDRLLHHGIWAECDPTILEWTRGMADRKAIYQLLQRQVMRL